MESTAKIKSIPTQAAEKAGLGFLETTAHWNSSTENQPKRSQRYWRYWNNLRMSCYSILQGYKRLMPYAVCTEEENCNSRQSQAHSSKLWNIPVFWNNRNHFEHLLTVYFRAQIPPASRLFLLLLGEKGKLKYIHVHKYTEILCMYLHVLISICMNTEL